MKVLFIFSLFLITVSFCVANSRLGVDPKRLYEYVDLNNNTVREWMTVNQILETVAECGKADQSRAQSHGGFFDVTDQQQVIRAPVYEFDYPTEMRNKQRVAAFAEKINIENVKKTIEDLSNYFTRYYTTDTGVQAAQYIYNKFVSYSNVNSRCTVRYYPHSWAQPSLIGRVAGKSSELVILGAHEDSIRSGSTPTLQAPGADDDASGTATVLETYRVMCSDPNYFPDYTLEFQTFSAEEVGLRGSQAIATDYANRGLKVVGMLQMDMTAYKNGNAAIITDYTNKKLTDFLIECAAAYTKGPWDRSTCGYACSDHASYDRVGYPAAFPFEATMSRSNSNIHTIRDTMNILNWPHAEEFVKLALGFMTELGTK